MLIFLIRCNKNPFVVRKINKISFVKIKGALILSVANRNHRFDFFDWQFRVIIEVNDVAIRVQLDHVTFFTFACKSRCKISIASV